MKEHTLYYMKALIVNINMEYYDHIHHNIKSHTAIITQNKIYKNIAP